MTQPDKTKETKPGSPSNINPNPDETPGTGSDQPPDPSNIPPESPLQDSSTDLRLEYLDPRDLNPNPKNFRQHGGRQRQTMSDIIDEFGMITGIVWNETTGNIIDGHMRVEEFIERNATTIPVVVCNLSQEQEDAAILYFDRVATMAGVDRELEIELARKAQNDSEALERMRQEILAGTGSMEPSEGDLNEDVPTDKFGVGLVPGEGFHYVVLMFRTELDWNSAVDHFKLERQQDAFRPSLQKMQTVVDGAEYLTRIKGIE